jgi:hypothetical protein
MKSWIERYTAPLILIVVFVSFIAFAYRIWNQVGLKPGAESLTLLNDIIVLGTALVLIWYTYETYKLRETAQKQIEVAQGQLAESQRQTELQLRPFVILEVSISEHDEFSYRVRNIGVGTAINVHIMDIQPDGADWSFRFLLTFFRS